jgi:hypothetical protein
MSAIGDILRVLAQTNQPGGMTTSGGQDALSNVLGGLMSGSQGSGQSGQVLGALEQMISAGRAQNNIQNTNVTGNDPLLNMIQPVAEQLSRRTGLQPQAAQAVVSLILHRMLSSHPSMGSSNARLNLAEVFQQMASSGGINPATLHNSGMVNDLVNASGMDKQAALNNLSEAFNLLNGHVQNPAGH